MAAPALVYVYWLWVGVDTAQLCRHYQDHSGFGLIVFCALAAAVVTVTVAYRLASTGRPIGLVVLWFVVSALFIAATVASLADANIITRVCASD